MGKYQNRKDSGQRVVRMSSVREETVKTSKKGSTGGAIARGIGKVILTMFLILLIVVCVVGTAMTVFIMKYVDSGSSYNLDDITLGYTSNIYAKDAEGNDVIVQSMAANGRRIWVDVDEIPQFVQDAMVCAEDERFREHEGVDWPRTIAAFATTIPVIGDKLNFNSGGSTITQQLIKNINGDYYNRTPAVKIKEILGSLNLERNYTKTSILGAYMNYITLGYANYGIAAGAEFYFDKEVSELTIAEAAALVSITKSPNDYNPIDNPEANKSRRTWVINKMYEKGKITEEERDTALAEELKLVEYVDDGEEETVSDVYSWYTDAVIYDVRDDLMEQYGYTEEEAMDKIRGGGLQIYTPMNITLQDRLEAEFLNDYNFSAYAMEKPLNASMVIMDYAGNIVALVGDRGEKTESLCWNNAVQATRSQGSCMKPITVYGPALQCDLITWSTTFIDGPKMQVEKADGTKVDWPPNWDAAWTKKPMTVAYALQHSKNTIPIELIRTLGVDYCLDFLEKQLGISSIARGSDSEGTTLGMMAKGVYQDEFTAAYLMFGNGGYYSTPKTYTKVVNASGEILLQTDDEMVQVLDSDTAYIMNKLLQTVVTEPGATGTAATLGNIEVAGKTGTNENTDLTFVGCTPYYVASLWMGYNDNSELPRYYGYYSATAWRLIMKDVLSGYPGKKFELDSTGVKRLTYCADTGLIAGDHCTKTEVGYYKTSNVPATCSGVHDEKPEE